MPHSLRVRLKNLQRKGELTEKDIDRIFKALEQEPKTAHWVDRGTYIECSKCGCLAPSTEFADGVWFKKSNFCPDCGRKMVEPQESEVKNDWRRFE